MRLLVGATPVTEEPLREGSIVVVDEKQVRVRRLPAPHFENDAARLRLCNPVDEKTP
jgi:hypothetical protein